jgi:hypothetical protein
VQIDWFDLQAKLTPTSPSATDTGKNVEICRLLAQSNRIVDVLSLKHLSSKHGLGGYVKVGEPGFLLLEGLEENCIKCLDSLNIRSKDMMGSEEVPKWSTFTTVGKAFGMVADLKSGMSLPGKLAPLYSTNGTDKLKDVCQRVGLADSLGKAMY